jgi:hypothetical protein
MRDTNGRPEGIWLKTVGVVLLMQNSKDFIYQFPISKLSAPERDLGL